MIPPFTYLHLLFLSQLALSTPISLSPRRPTNSKIASNQTLTWLLPSGNHQHARTASESIPDPTTATVTLASAFLSGAGNLHNTNTSENSLAATNAYTCYSGPASNFPSSETWVSFDAMWAANSAALGRGCAVFGVSPENTGTQIQDIYDAIQGVAEASLVDHRFVLAVVMQESIGCVHVPTTNNAVTNPGIMQSFQGSTFVGNGAGVEEQRASIRQMVVDGTQGTLTGFGLVQGINNFGNIYAAARMYNSGSVDMANLNDGLGSTPSYVADVANRMTGWVDAPRPSC